MAFLTETFSFAYITCTFGPQWVGLILIFFGIANSISSVVLSRLQKYIGRIMIFVGGFLINFFLAISLLLEWIYPNPNMVEWYIIFVIFWGIGDSIWQRAIMGKPILPAASSLRFLFSGLYGALFFDDQEAAFSNRSLWKSIGKVVAFSYGAYISVSLKIYILLGCLILGIILYLICELIVYRNKGTDADNIETEKSDF